MTGAEIMGVVGFFILVSGTLWGIWWKIDGKVSVAEDRVDKVSVALADHRLHVAETYLTKQGMREAIEPIMDAIHGVKSAVDQMGGRIDGLYHSPTPRSRTTK